MRGSFFSVLGWSCAELPQKGAVEGVNGGKAAQMGNIGDATVGGT